MIPHTYRDVQEAVPYNPSYGVNCNVEDVSRSYLHNLAGAHFPMPLKIRVFLDFYHLFLYNFNDYFPHRETCFDMAYSRDNGNKEERVSLSTGWIFIGNPGK